MQHLLLLHGALGSQQQLDPLTASLGNRVQVHRLNFEGHGGRPTLRPFSIDVFVENIREYLEEQRIMECAIFGYSMGGYVALKFAALFPDKVTRVVTLGTKFEWSPAIAERETALLDPAKIEEKVPKFATALELAHAPLNWKEVVRHTAALMHDLGERPALQKTDLERVAIPVLLCLGTEDIMATPEETTRTGELLPNATVEFVPSWLHPIERVDPEVLAGKICTFLRV